MNYDVNLSSIIGLLNHILLKFKKTDKYKNIKEDLKDTEIKQILKKAILIENLVKQSRLKIVEILKKYPFQLKDLFIKENFNNQIIDYLNENNISSINTISEHLMKNKIFKHLKITQHIVPLISFIIFMVVFIGKIIKPESFRGFYISFSDILIFIVLIYLIELILVRFKIYVLVKKNYNNYLEKLINQIKLSIFKDLEDDIKAYKKILKILDKLEVV